MKILKNVQFEYANVESLDIGIIRIEMLGGHIIDLEESVQLNIVQWELLNDKLSSVLAIMVTDSTTHFTSDAREFSASK